MDIYIERVCATIYYICMYSLSHLRSKYLIGVLADTHTNQVLAHTHTRRLIHRHTHTYINVHVLYTLTHKHVDSHSHTSAHVRTRTHAHAHLCTFTPPPHLRCRYVIGVLGYQEFNRFELAVGLSEPERVTVVQDGSDLVDEVRLYM